ncbi:hypothetical protein [Luteipulveratus halotolerans]|uniref:Uncharacterized protein n=1 Tax=Luteipulveratus halotolerans TaxID=1631356 RepID=A0A0L6CPV0_9MICO|nr:hypothetical protein [Luteipulveratus halotolerans]KNX39685.1 hypothetical protein VV01_00155 [Luteipulveratus halotolerans]
MSWEWLGEWARSPGFGGVAAVAAAVIAYRAASKNAKSQADQAVEDRWWDQAKWAVEQLAVDRQMALSALQHLAESAPTVAAGDFLQAVALPIIDAPGEDDEADSLEGDRVFSVHGSSVVDDRRPQEADLESKVDEEDDDDDHK